MSDFSSSAFINNTNTVVKDNTIGDKNTNTMKSEEIRSIVGTDLRSSTTYLFSALVSRAGEGRRRVLMDLLEVLKVPNVQFTTTSKLKAVIFIAETILYLLNPPSQLNNSD